MRTSRALLDVDGRGRSSPRDSCADKTTGTQLYSSAKPRFGKLQLQFARTSTAARIGSACSPDAARHLDQNAVNLRLLFIEQPHQLVVLFDGFERLDENGLPARAGAVHHALHAPFLLDLYRDHKALTANCDQLVLQPRRPRITAADSRAATPESSVAAFRFHGECGRVPARLCRRACRRAESCCEKLAGIR